MNAVFAKMQYKYQGAILVSKAPPEFEPALDEMRELAKVVTRASGKKQYPFALYFVRSSADIELPF